jgi:hypothetical protein
MGEVFQFYYSIALFYHFNGDNIIAIGNIKDITSCLEI